MKRVLQTAGRHCLATAGVLGAVLLAAATLVQAGGRSDGPKVDPIEANGTIFKTEDGADWPKPDAVLLFTGEQKGYIEPCGCAGLTNQKGGLKRRHTFIKQLNAQGWPVLPLDAGGLIKRYGQQAQIKYSKTVEAYGTIGYRGVGFGDKDLRMEVDGVAINLEPDANPFVSANIGFWGFDEAMSRRWRVEEVGGLKIGFTSVLTDSLTAKLPDNPDIDVEPAADALKAITPKLTAAGCDQLVLLVYGSADEARSLAKQFPAYRWIVTAKGAEEPPYITEKIEGTESYLIETGHKGMYGVAIGLYRGGGGKAAAGKQTFRYQKVPFDHRFEDSPQMEQLMVDYQNDLRSFGYDGLGVKQQLHPAHEISKSMYAGSKTCEDCHYEEYEIWAESPHFNATKSIVDLEPARHFDPECISCHVTGWEPQKYFPFKNGWVNLQETPHLDAQGCENCHGPAARHAAAQSGDIDVSDEELEQLNAALHLEIVEDEGNLKGQVMGDAVKVCLTCHDLDNSPEFNFQEYWQVVKHGENWPRDEDEADEEEAGERGEE